MEHMRLRSFFQYGIAIFSFFFLLGGGVFGQFDMTGCMSGCLGAGSSSSADCSSICEQREKDYNLSNPDEIGGIDAPGCFGENCDLCGDLISSTQSYADCQADAAGCGNSDDRVSCLESAKALRVCLSKCVTFEDGSKGEACECKCYGGVPLNTNVPFVGKCIQMNEEGKQAGNDPNTAVVTPTSAFPMLMKGLSRVALSLFLALSFVMVIASGVIIATSGANSSGMSQGTTLLKRVVMSFVLLGTIGVILCLINPFFFCPQLF